MGSMLPGQAVSLLASQTPSFSGHEDEDVELWVRRVDRAALIHRVPDTVILLAATSKLQKHARSWFDLDTGPITDSWSLFKEALIKRFRRRLPFHAAMQKVEACRWMFPKESFQDYASRKLKLMHNLQMPIRDQILLLINGINDKALRSAATVLQVDTVEDFLEKMFDLTPSWAGPTKRFPSSPSKKEKSKEHSTSSNKTSGGSSDSKISCAYCKAKGHLKIDCFKLKRREQSQSATSPTSASATTPSTAATTDVVPDKKDDTVASVLSSGS